MRRGGGRVVHEVGIARKVRLKWIKSTEHRRQERHTLLKAQFPPSLPHASDTEHSRGLQFGDSGLSTVRRWF